MNSFSQSAMRSKLLTVLLLIPFSVGTAVIIDKIAAIVNEDVITQSELVAAEQLQLNLSGLPARETMLQKRIDHHLVLQQLSNQPPVAVSDEEVSDALTSIRARYGDDEKLNAFLTSIGMSSADLDREIREQITIHKFVTDRFRPFVDISIEDAEEYYENVYRPGGEMLGKTVPPFEESFPEIQRLLVESRLKDKIQEWLDEIRSQATINVKD